MGVLDAFLDSIHVIVRLFQADRLISLNLWISELVLVLHLAYSAYLAYYTVQLVRMHTGFIIRNELTVEWQRDEFYIIYDHTGDAVAVQDLDDDEFDANFNNFVYDPSRNKWDKGWKRNCMSFWFKSRFAHGQRGEF